MCEVVESLYGTCGVCYSSVTRNLVVSNLCENVIKLISVVTVFLLNYNNFETKAKYLIKIFGR